MLKSLAREITLTVQARTGASPALLLWLAVAALASLTAFAFLCVAGYSWLTLEFGSVFAALIMTGIFLLIAAIAAMICALARRRAKERAILERAARAHASSWLLDPKLLAAAVQLGRTIGWQRLVPVALLGFMAAQWAREYREQKPDNAD
jgi:type VI protein secretion system component VasK